MFTLSDIISMIHDALLSTSPDRRLDGQGFAAPSPAATQNVLAVSRGHTGAKPVFTLSFLC